MPKYPYQNPDLTIRERVNDLMSRLSLKEKVGQVNQHLYGWECYEKQPDGSVLLTEKLKEHIQWGGGLGALYGLFRADPWSKVGFDTGIKPEDSWKLVNQVQEYVMSQSRWKIPALIVEECPHGHQGLGGISYPTNLGRGNSFNTDLIKRSSRLMAKELSAKGVHLALVSTLDLVKDPRWGRSEECFGEDPILAAKMSEAVVAGFQGDLIDENISYLDQTVSDIQKRPEQIGVVLKHCIAQGEALGGHNAGTVTIGNREFNDVYLPLLKSARNAVGVMAAYNDVDGVPCHINHELFQKTMRKELGYQGIVMADGIALDRLEDVFDTQLEGASAALKAGVDLSLWDQTYLQIEEGIKTGIIEEATLDAACRNVLGIKFLLGLFDNPYVTDPKDSFNELLTESHEMNLQVAEESLTLVKNDGILPLNQPLKKIAVVGPNGNGLYELLGDYTAPQVDSLDDRTIYHQIKKHFPQTEVVYSEGCEIRNTENQDQKIAAALAVCEDADVIVLVLGGSSARNFDMEFLKNGAVSSKGINMDSGENVDVASLTLGGCQLDLLEQIQKLRKPLVSVLIQGRPYDIRKVEAVSNAVLIGWFPGQQGGAAIAKVLCGATNPSGRLSVSYPRNSEQLPVYYYQRAASKKEDYYDEPGAPLHEFGYGLSYTDFSYQDLQLGKDSDTITVNVTVTNEGTYVGKESLLLFVRLSGGSVIQRHKLLKDFKKIELASGESKRVTLSVPISQLTYTDIDRTIKTAEGCRIFIGDLSEEISLSKR